MTDDDLLVKAEAILRQRMTRDGVPLLNAGIALSHATLTIGTSHEEKLIAYWLDRHGNFIALDEIATGNEAELSFSVRRVVRLAIERNAWLAIFIHNHPNGDPAASDPDRRAAEKIDHALAIVGTFVRGHYTLGQDEAEDVRTGQRLPLFKALTPANTCPTCGHKLGEQNAN